MAMAADSATVTIDSLLADLDEQIAQAVREVDLLALLRLIDLQGQKRGMLKVVAYSQQQVARVELEQHEVQTNGARAVRDST